MFPVPLRKRTCSFLTSHFIVRELFIEFISNDEEDRIQKSLTSNKLLEEMCNNYYPEIVYNQLHAHILYTSIM